LQLVPALRRQFLLEVLREEREEREEPRWRRTRRMSMEGVSTSET
jgi:hypothetical protein